MITIENSKYVCVYIYIYTHTHTQSHIYAHFTVSLQKSKTPQQGDGEAKFDIKRSDGETPAMLSTPSLLSLSGSPCPRMVVPDWVLSMGQIELFDI